MPRPIWKGYITFGLVNIPVVLYSAEKKYDIQFKLVDSRDQARIRYERINEHTGEEVPWHDIAKAFEYDENNYVLLKDTDLKKIAGENSKTINIESFVNLSQLDYLDFEKPYYLIPDKKSEKGYVLLREVLKETKKVGIAKVIIHTRQYLAAIMPYEDAIVLNLMRYHHEIRQPSEFELPSDNLKTYKITAKEIEIAKQLVDSMTHKWNPEDYQDEYRIALEKWIDEKIHHEKPRAKLKGTKPSTSNVINFADLLKKSLHKQKIPAKKKTTRTKTPKKKSAGKHK